MTMATPMRKKRLLVTGGSGYLGQHLLPEAAGRFELYGAYRTHPGQLTAGEPVFLDLTNQENIRQVIADLRPEAVIHAAAVNPGRGSAEEMLRVNRDGARAVAEAAASIGAKLVHVSSDVIFDGQQAPYADDAPPSPLNDYGRSKAAGEAAVREVHPQAAIVRTSLIYGLERMDRGTESFVRQLEQNGSLTLFRDVIRQPVWVQTLSQALLKLVNLDFFGTLNVAGRQALTREAFGRKMLAWWGIETEGRVHSGRAAEISATIPLDLRLTVDKGQQLLGMPFPGVDEVLAT